MCIICAKPAGVKMPTSETREIMWKGNPDGAGIMWVENGKVRIAKGLMKQKRFEAFLTELSSKIDMVKTPIVMHFRITTHGGTKPENCHPFPITENLGLLQKLNSTCEIGVAHNGILSFTPRQGISDTMEYILTQLSVIKRINRKFYMERKFLELISNATAGSRLCFLTSNGEIVTTGVWEKDESGLLYSNSNYKKIRLTYGMYTDAWSSYYDYNTHDDEKLLCSAEDLFVDVVVNGESVVDIYDYYIDKYSNVYKYDEESDLFEKQKNARVVEGDYSVKWNFDDAISVSAYSDSVLYPNYGTWGGVMKCDICGTHIKNDLSNYGYDDDDVVLCKDCTNKFGYSTNENYAW